METNRVTNLCFFSALLSVAGLELAGHWIFSTTPIPLLGGLAVLRGLETAVILAIFIKWGNGLGRLGLAKEQLGPGIIQGIVWSAACGVLAGLAWAGFWAAGYSFTGLLGIRSAQLPEWIYRFSVGALIAPVAEEIFFRGVVYGFFRKWGAATALLISASVFAFVHSSFGVTQIAGGLLFGLAYERKGCLSAAIVIHIIGNAALFLLAWTV